MVFRETNTLGKRAKTVSEILVHRLRLHQRYGKMDVSREGGKEGESGELSLGFLFGQPVISQELGLMPKDSATSVMPG